MNKWIPISFVVFLGIFLLTTAQASITASPSAQVSCDLVDNFNNTFSLTLL